MQSILPRFIRYRDAPAYLGMDKNRFNTEVRPDLTEIPIGNQGIAFDRLDLDAWADDYKQCNGRFSKSSKTGDDTWDINKKERQVLPKGKVFGTSTKGGNTSQTGGFEKAVERLNSKRRKNT